MPIYLSTSLSVKNRIPHLPHLGVQRGYSVRLADYAELRARQAVPTCTTPRLFCWNKTERVGSVSR